MKEVLKFIPGFRSGTKWRMIIAGIYYLIFLTALTSGIGIFLFIESIPFVVFYGIKAFKVRKREPIILVIIAFIVMSLGIGLAPTTQTNISSKAAASSDKSNTSVTRESNVKDKTENGTNTTPAAVATVNNLSVSGELKVHFINVGQADAILIQQGNANMLIDAGNNDDEAFIKSYLDNLGIKEFQVVIGTHVHEDHIGSMDYIINSFKVGKVYFPKQTANTKTFESFINAVKGKGLSLTTPIVGETFKIGGAAVTILAPNSSSYEDENDYSIVTMVQYGSTKFLLTGDAEAVSEMEMVQKGLNLKADVLKVGHHGSKTSTVANFLSAVSPKYAVISVGKNNSYGHPAQSTLDRLKNAGVTLYRTDENGTIVATSNGKDITFSTKPGSYVGIDSNTESSSSSVNTANQTESTSKTTVVPVPVSKPTPEPVQEQTAVPAPVQNVSVSASVDNPNPTKNSTIHVNVNGPAGGAVNINFHYKSKNTPYSGTIGSDGKAVIPVKIGTASAGYTVNIDVNVSQEGKTYSTQTSFTPR